MRPPSGSGLSMETVSPESVISGRGEVKRQTCCDALGDVGSYVVVALALGECLSCRKRQGEGRLTCGRDGAKKLG